MAVWGLDAGRHLDHDAFAGPKLQRRIGFGKHDCAAGAGLSTGLGCRVRCITVSRSVLNSAALGQRTRTGGSSIRKPCLRSTILHLVPGVPA